MPPYIPPEITDTIISAVPLVPYRTFRPSLSHTLAMCALVCRAWLPRSRIELFENILIRDDHTYDLLVERVLHSVTMSPNLASVDSLRLGRFNRSDPRSKAGRLFFLEFAGKLPGLRTLSVFNVDFTHQRPSVTWPLLLSQFRTITSLKLFDCQFSSFSDVRRLLTALPLLSTLVIAYLTWPVVSHEVHLQTTLRPRTFWPELHTLRIYHLPPESAAMFLRWITGALRGSPVKVLLCDPDLPSTGSLQEAVDAFVGRVGPSVTDLETYITDNWPLSGFIALERLSCDLRHCKGKWEGVASVLQGVLSNTIQSITFDAVYTHRLRPRQNHNATYLRFDDDTLEELDRVLSGEPFGRLREVILRVLADEEEEEEVLRAHARRCLPELHKRKIFCLYILTVKDLDVE
ncbi:hypothetical protein L226DRAFT_576328 [Lentinus tigrinus ALCF2SS1-7]|uniref:uncharacterized protein n=1 Tax=Lentinus tigrinus ALCF2SS1-7 TaxID=1328758 RepID=UPI0011660D16|nr:hypothetical protein L226DRAFT_576328 [Lentinus tigrinus ALCF2SS1-7]